MTQQDMRGWPQNRSLGWAAPQDRMNPDEQFSDRDSSNANPLDERFSDPESSIVGETPFHPRQDLSTTWRSPQLHSNGLQPNGSLHDVPRTGTPNMAEPESLHSPRSHPPGSQYVLLSPRSALDVDQPSRAPLEFNSFGTDNQINDSRWRNPDLNEIIDYLRDGNDAVKANAAAYLQHLTYLDDNIKKLTRSLNGIRALVDLITNPITEVHRAACGTLRNLSFGKNNDENKREIKNADGIDKLVKLLRITTESDVRELVTGILWNLSSCSDLKKSVIDEGLKTIVDYVIKPAAGLQQSQISGSSVGDYRSTVFRNASGVLRNVSSDGEYARHKLRECDGLVDATIIVVRAAMSNDDMDNKSVENCVCILRNLSYACQETVDPNYLQKRMQSSRAAHQDETVGCFGGKKKKAGMKDIKGAPQKGTPTYGDSIFMLKEKALWQPEILNIYLPLLADCNNPDTLEAAAGAIQNLAAGDWQPAEVIRSTIRQEKGLPIIVSLLGLNSDRVVCAAATALRNLALDTRNKELIGKYAMQQLVQKLPSANGPSELQLLSNDTITAVESALYEIIKTNSTHAKSLMTEGGIERLMFIVHSAPNEYSEKAVRFASQLLVRMWQFNEFHDEYKRKGWRQVDFMGSSGTGFKSQLASADNTINRPHQSQSGQGGLNTARIDRQSAGTFQPPPYVLHGGSSTSITAQPYTTSLQPRVTSDIPLVDRRYASSELHSEVGQVTRPPVYDAVGELNGEPPMYSYHGNNGVTGNRPLNVDTQYRSDMGLGGAPVARYTADMDDPRSGADVSFDSQVNASPYGMQDIRGRLSPADAFGRDSSSTHGQRMGDSTLFADRYPLDRSQEPVYARVQKDDRYGDILHYNHVSERRTNDVDSWV